MRRNLKEAHYDEVTHVTGSCNGQIFVTGSKDQRLKIWNLDGELISELKGHINQITGLILV